MTDLCHLTITYPDGRVVRTVHRGDKVDWRMRARFQALGCRLKLGRRLNNDKAQEYELPEAASAGPGRLGWHPHLDLPEGDDGNDD